MPASTLALVLAVVATAALTSATTLGIAYLLYVRRLRPRLEAELEARLAAARAELEARLKAAAGELGEVVQDRVRRGVLDALTSLPTAEGLRGTAEGLGRTGAELLARLGLGRAK